MELADFIKASLLDLATGLREANQELMAERKQAHGVDRSYFSVGPIMAGTKEHSHVDFDVAITVTAEKSGGLKGTLGIAVVDAGITGENSRSAERVSRLKFSVRLERPLD